jgi:hypothetical protein
MPLEQTTVAVAAWILFLGVMAILATAGYWLLPLWNWVGPSRQPARAPRFAAVRTRSLLPFPLEAALAQHEGPLAALGFEPQVAVRDVRDAAKIRSGTSGVTQYWVHPVHGDRRP